MNIDERVYGYELAASQLKELRSEIERLHKSLEKEQGRFDARLSIKQAEIERLRQMLKDAGVLEWVIDSQG